MRILLAVLLWSLAPTFVFAQGCPAGLAGQPGCIPPWHPASPYSQSPRGAAGGGEIWESRWGAIAIDHSTGRGGFSVAERSKRSAEQVARESCRGNGGVACKTWIVYSDSCVVYMGSSNYSVGETGVTVDLAKQAALRDCREHGEECEMVYHACSMPQRIR